jgi:hypothetical protein
MGHGRRAWRYGFCDWRDASGVGLVDYAFLSLLSYLEPDSREFEMLLHHYSTGRGYAGEAACISAWEWRPVRFCDSV